MHADVSIRPLLALQDAKSALSEAQQDVKRLESERAVAFAAQDPARQATLRQQYTAAWAREQKREEELKDVFRKARLVLCLLFPVGQSC
jgi:hypothetical protein